MSDPTPPKGYQLDPAVQDTSTVPAFIQQGIDVGSVQQSIAPESAVHGSTDKGYHTVAESNPGVISVFRPGEYDVPVRNHEMTHEFQQTRDFGGIKLPGDNTLDLPGQTKPYSADQYRPGDHRNYAYGGVQGLLKARQQGKTVANFNREQQADIVADYKEMQDDYQEAVAAGTATPGMSKMMEQVRQAYHPFVQQLADVPKYSAARSIGTFLGIGSPDAPPAPRAPGLPAYGTPGLGYVQPDSLLGGDATVIPPEGYQLSNTAGPAPRKTQKKSVPVASAPAPPAPRAVNATDAWAGQH
jgi:hypothetical protein